MHLDGVESVEELDAVELKDEFPEYLLAQKGGLFAIVEEHYSEEPMVLRP